jgi:hypothetical protein
MKEITMRNLLEYPITDEEIIQCLEYFIGECDTECVGDMRPLLLGAAIKRIRDNPAAPSVYMGNFIFGRVSGKPRECAQYPGMWDSICHACGLGEKCLDEDCPNGG